MIAIAPPPPVTSLVAVGACPPAGAHLVEVGIEGFRRRVGKVRVRLFGGAPSTYFDKHQALVRVEVPVPAAGPVRLCLAAPGPGVYALDVRHDLNGNGKTDRQDGGGASGNPHMSLLDVLFSRKPSPASVQFRVGAGTTGVPVVLTYLQGGSFERVPDGG
ncbi:DUF2141 domain-containing protein [Sphingomonas bacterium]|uniref:DUF2141 domain-containing protein n=1 Tax=Sphingomonas bacterium TaxID=1895847 RepID=UPI001576FB7F|nr:DUF2141 domain-containing protein [Sphingomonas bacterium]